MLGLELDDSYYEEQKFDVFPENHEALNVFLACGNQWRVISGMKGNTVQGLDVTAIVAVMQAYKVENTGECLDKVQLIESGALEVINKR